MLTPFPNILLFRKDDESIEKKSRALTEFKSKHNFWVHMLLGFYLAIFV
jgi:hypothetical protein